MILDWFRTEYCHDLSEPWIPEEAEARDSTSLGTPTIKYWNIIEPKIIGKQQIIKNS